MHLHDVLRLWRDEIVGASPTVAFSEEDAGPALPQDLPRDVIPGGLRRDDPASLAVRLVPATHHPSPPATDRALDGIEGTLGFELPRSVELLLRLHDGGDFFRPAMPALPEALGGPIRLLSVAEIALAFDSLARQVRTCLSARQPEWDDLLRLARRFGVVGTAAADFAGQMRALLDGRQDGFQVVPVARDPRRPEDLVCLVPQAGPGGQVGCLCADAGYLPEHSDDLAFDGLEGWLLAVIRGRGCHRVVLT